MHATSSENIVNDSKPCVCRESKPGSSKYELLHGSRIDKLYYDQYLPLREKKLIEKLVRTRAVYDDIRNRILESDTDINENYGCENKGKLIIATDNNPIHEIVSFIDRGKLSTFSSSFNLHSECCSCCDCKPRITRQPKVHGHVPSLEIVKEYLSKHKDKIKSDSRLHTLQLSSEKNRLKYESKHHQHLKPILKSTKKYEIKVIKEHKKLLIPIICKCFEKLKTKGSIVSIKYAANKIKESVHSSNSIMGNKFRNLKKDSLILYKEQNKNNKKYDPMEDWACAPGFCIPRRCNAPECYKEIKRRLPDLDHKRKIRFADDKIQTYENEIKSAKQPRETKVHKIFCKCYTNIKSAASMTNVSVAKTTSTNKRLTKTKSVSSAEKQKQRKKKGLIAISNKPNPFPRECDPGMCEIGKCNSEDCAKILLKSSRGAHKFDRRSSTKQLKKRKEPKAKKTKKPEKQKVQNFFCECDSIKSTASATTPSVARTTTTKKSTLATKSTSSTDNRKLRRSCKGVSKPLPFPRECDSGMCEPGQCDPEDCAKILLKNSRAAHNMDRCYCNLNKNTKKVKPETFSEECTCAIKYKEAVILKETATQPKKRKKNTTKTTPPTSKVKSVQKDIGRCFCTLDLKKTLVKESIVPKDVECMCSSSTSTARPKPIPKKTKMASASVPKTINVQTRAPKRRKPSKPTVIQEKEEYSLKSISAPGAPSRQVVRISSSFRFDVEFFKENSYPNTNEITPTNDSIVVAPSKKEAKNAKIRKTENRTERVEPLKRCTLELDEKLRKKPKIQKTKKSGPKKVEHEPEVCCKSVSTITCEYTSKSHVLKKTLPYECKPGPFVCKKKNEKMRSCTETNTDITQSTTNATTTSKCSSKTVSRKCSECKSKSTKNRILARCFCTKDLHVKEEKCFCTKSFYENQRKRTQTKKKISPTKTSTLRNKRNSLIPEACDSIQCKARINKSNESKQKSFVVKCFCKLNKEKERKQEIPVTRTIETQTAKKKHKKDDVLICDKYEHRKPNKPKRKSAYSCCSSEFNKTQDSSTDIRSRKTKMHNAKCGHRIAKLQGRDEISEESLPSSSSNERRQALRIGSQLSFSIEFYKNVKFPKIKKDKGPKMSKVRSRGDSANLVPTNNIVCHSGNSANIRYVQICKGSCTPVFASTGLKLEMKSHARRFIDE